LATRSLAGSSARLSAANLAFVALGTAQVLVVGAVFGTGRAFELFVLAWMVPEWCLFGLGNVMQMHLTPALLRLGARLGPDEEKAATWSLLVCVSAFLALACGIGALAAPAVLGLAAPGIGCPELPEAVSLFRFLLLTAFAQGLVRLFSSLHRVGHSLVISALTQTATPLAVIALLLWARDLGSWALALGFLIGALVNLACLVPGPLAWGFLRPRARVYHPLVGDLARSALPLMLATTGFRLVVLLDRTVASGLEPGDATLLRYALFFLMSVQSILVMPLLNVGYNRLSALHAEGDKGAAGVVFLFLQVLWMLVIPATLALVLFASPFVAVFLGRAAFDAEAVARTAGVLAAFAPALPFVVGYMIVLQAFLSRRRYLYATVLSLLIPLASFGVKLAAGPRLGVRGVAFATAVTMAVWFLALLGRLLPAASAEARGQLYLRGAWVLLATALTAGLLVVAWPLLPAAPLPRLVVGCSLLGTLYVSGLFLLGRRHLVSLWRELSETAVGA
jgi:putative peptidoglycan lipid II flippase